MKKILLLAGTTEGRMLAKQLEELPVYVYISTATDYGKECIVTHQKAELQDKQQVLNGRMNQSEMADFIREKGIDLVIDATHPFAIDVTKSLKQACMQCKVEYLRCLRESQKLTGEEEDAVVFVDSIQEAVEYLKNTTGKILITTGSKELPCYTQIPNYKERCVVRVLSTKEAVGECERFGFRGKNLIAMQGPFDKALNKAMIRHVDAAFFITKESGKEGGFLEKMEAAKETGVRLIVIRRPKEEGRGLQEVWEYVSLNI